jgi:hypothetical protein
VSDREPCENCGAPKKPGAECDYCSPTVGRALDPGVLAATIAGADGDIESAIGAMAERLAASFPDQTAVEHSGGLLSAKKVKLLEVTIEPHIYRVRRDGKRLIAERAKVVRGVSLKTSKLEFADWVRELSTDLAAMAKATAASRAALAKWVRGA